VRVLTHLLVIILSLVCVIKGINLAFGQWNQISPALGIPMTFAHLAVPFNFALIIMYSVELIIRDAKEIHSERRAVETIRPEPLLKQ